MNFLKNTYNSLFGKKEQKEKPKEVEVQQIDIPQEPLVQLFHFSTKFLGESKHPITDQAKLQLYGYFKQATVGDCDKPKPAIYQIVAKAKWQAWSALKGMSAATAMKKYIALAAKADPTIQKKMRAEGEQQGQEGVAVTGQKSAHMSMQGSALKMVEQKDFSDNYSHPYFKSIQKGLPIGEITRELLLQVNNNPKVYPLHFAIDKERQDLVGSFLEKLSKEDIEGMKDEEGTGILEYAELIENEAILGMVRERLSK